MSYTCYGCKSKIGFDELRYECMCTEKKGVCKSCIEKKVNIVIPEHHSLVKLHDLTDEYKNYFKSIEDEIGVWTGMFVDHDGNYVYNTYCEKGKEQGSIPGVESDRYPGTIVKTVVKPPPPKKSCTCCSE